MAYDGDSGLEKALMTRYDVVVLDRDLPVISGDDLCRQLTAEGSLTRVLMLTAAGGLADRVAGLELGADDYLGKPFAFSELLARVHALLRRGSSVAGQAEQVLRLGDELEVDLLRRKATRAGRRLDLTAKEFTLLTALLRRPGRVMSRAVLAEQVWGMNYDSDTNVVDVLVRRLRSKLDDPFQHKLLQTVRGMGYVLEAGTPDPP